MAILKTLFLLEGDFFLNPPLVPQEFSILSTVGTWLRWRWISEYCVGPLMTAISEMFSFQYCAHQISMNLSITSQVLPPPCIFLGGFHLSVCSGKAWLSVFVPCLPSFEGSNWPFLLPSLWIHEEILILQYFQPFQSFLLVRKMATPKLLIYRERPDVWCLF